MINKNNNITYENCGIPNVDSFYKDKFAHNVSYDIEQNNLYEYNILSLKQMYVYDYIKPNSTVLDFGCGSGVFKILKKLNTYIVGIDMSIIALENAKTLNNYDEVYSLDIFDDFYDKFQNHFDYIISSDVFGHIEFMHKDKVIQRLKQLLKKDGTMIHGIETGDIKYNELSIEDRTKFAIVDGHVGMESEETTTKRFQQYFQNVNTYTPYGIVNDLEEIIKQSQSYDVSYLDSKLIDYLKSKVKDKSFLDAFNISQYCAHKAYEETTPSNTFFNLYGFSFLVCSDKNIVKYSHDKPQSNIQFSTHFYQEEKLNDTLFRWSQPYSYINLTNIKDIKLSLSSYIPAYTQKEQNVRILINGKIVKTLLFTNEINCLEYTFVNEEKLSNVKIEFYADSSFTPLLFEENDDNRVLAFNLSILEKETL